jgi:hypothetical protein
MVNRLGIAPVLTSHVARGDHRVDDGFFRGLHRGLEQRVKLIVADNLRVTTRHTAERTAIGGGERHEDVARAIARIAAHARQSHARALGDAVQLVRQ